METNVFIVIPAKDEANRLPDVLRQTYAEGFRQVVVVNDGSRDDTADRARAMGAAVLSHCINLGAGAATQTGIEYALDRGADVIVTMDGDRQHLPGDIRSLVDTLRKEEVDIVIGSRFMNKDNQIPLTRRFYNWVGNYLTVLLTGVIVSDSQSGMKAIRADFARKLNFHFNGYEFCTEFFMLISRHRASYREVPIRVNYDSEVMGKGQNLGSGFKMLGQFFRYLFS